MYSFFEVFQPYRQTSMAHIGPTVWPVLNRAIFYILCCLLCGGLGFVATPHVTYECFGIESILATDGLCLELMLLDLPFLFFKLQDKFKYGRLPPGVVVNKLGS